MTVQNTITFNDSEIHAVLICHTRYCLGRRSYAVSQCADLLKHKWSQIPVNTQVIIRRDVAEAIAMDDRLLELKRERIAKDPSSEDLCYPMDWCDRSTWVRLIDFIDRFAAGF
jgi:hypothetical protein